MAQSTDKTLSNLIINRMPQSVYDAKKAAGELSDDELYLTPAAGGWELINEITIPEGAEETNSLTIDKDLNGQPFSLKHAILYAHFPAYTGESTIPNFGFAMLNGKTAGSVTGVPLGYTGVYPKQSSTDSVGCVWNVEVNGELWHEKVIRGSKLGVLNGVSERKYGNISITESNFYGSPNNIGLITSIGGTAMLIYPGCYFKLIGVRA